MRAKRKREGERYERERPSSSQGFSRAMPKSARTRSPHFSTSLTTERYESLYLAFIAGLCGFGLSPRATLEIPTSDRRLDRIVELIRRLPVFISRSFESPTRPQVASRRHDSICPSSWGLPSDWALGASATHQWFVFEEVPHRLSKSLSDLNGTDPLHSRRSAHGVLRGLMNALTRNIHESRAWRSWKQFIAT